jgi:hypothetical protein
MKTIPEILANINSKIQYHQKEIAKVVEELTEMKKGRIPQTDETKLKLMRSAMIVAEHKGIISTLDTLYKEIQE